MNRHEDNLWGKSSDDEGGREQTEADPLLLPQTQQESDDTRPKHRKVKSLWTIPTGMARKPRGHHRHKSSLGQLADTFRSSMGTIAEGMQAESELVSGTFLRELQDAHEGRTFFLDMSMTRSLSLLPESLPSLLEETIGSGVPTVAEKDGEAMQAAEVEAIATGAMQIPSLPEKPICTALGPYLALLSAVLAVSSSGTALKTLHGVKPALKLYWRMTATYLVLSFFAIKTMIVHYKQRQKQWATGELGNGHMISSRWAFFPPLTMLQWVTFFCATFCYSAHTLLFITALEYTSIGNAVIGANSQAILLILGKLLVGQRVVLLEGIGVLIAFAGCVLCSMDEAKDSDQGTSSSSSAIIGDVLAFASGAMGVGYLTFAKAVRPYLPVTVFMFLVMLIGSFLILLFMVVTEHPSKLSLSNDPFVGLFGWMNLSHHRLFILLHIAVVCNVLGTMGFVRAMQYHDNVIIAVATLLEPMIATGKFQLSLILQLAALPCLTPHCSDCKCYWSEWSTWPSRMDRKRPCSRRNIWCRLSINQQANGTLNHEKGYR